LAHITTFNSVNHLNLLLTNRAKAVLLKYRTQLNQKDRYSTEKTTKEI